jgi:hypothetical protein
MPGMSMDAAVTSAVVTDAIREESFIEREEVRNNDE